MSMDEEYALGDIIVFERELYRHVGIYVGGWKVIHLWQAYQTEAFCVRMDDIHFVVERGEQQTSVAPQNRTEWYDRVMYDGYSKRPLADQETIVARALSCLGETNYSELSWNCEHFVVWARYNTIASPQVTRTIGDSVRNAALGILVGGWFGLCAVAAYTAFTHFGGSNPSTTSASSSRRLLQANDEQSRAGEIEAVVPSSEKLNGFELPLLQTLVVRGEYSCRICVNEYKKLTDKICYLPCHHTFCFECNTKLLTNDRIRCPFCRRDFAKNQVQSIALGTIPSKRHHIKISS